jgi:hypothetical protein
MSTTFYAFTFVSYDGGTEGVASRLRAARLLNAAADGPIPILTGRSRNDWLPYMIKELAVALELEGLAFISDDAIAPEQDGSSKWLVSNLDASAIARAIKAIEQLLKVAADDPQSVADLVGQGESAEKILTGVRSPGIVKDNLLSPAGDSLEGRDSLYLLSYLGCPLATLRDAQAHGCSLVHLRLMY